METRATQIVKAERREREGQFDGLRKEFREQQQVVRSEVAEISAALRKLTNGNPFEHQKTVDNFERNESEHLEKDVQREILNLRHADEESKSLFEYCKREIKTLERVAEENVKEMLTMRRAIEEEGRVILKIKQESEESRNEVLAVVKHATEEMKKQTLIFERASEDCKVKTAACIDDYVSLKEEVKAMQKTMFEWQAFRVKQDANMAKVLKLFDDHNEDFDSIRKFDTDIKALIDQMLVHSETHSKFNTDLTKAKKKVAECIDEFQEIRQGHNEFKRLFQEYQRDCDQLTDYLPESKKSADTPLFDRMKIMFHKSHKLQPLSDHMDDLKNMIDKAFAELEGELRSKLQKEKEEQLLSAMSLETKLDDHLVLGKQHSERLRVLEHDLEQDRTMTHERLAMVPDRNEISKQLSKAIEEQLARTEDKLQDELMKRSDALHEQARKFTADTFHGLRRAQLLDVQSHVKQQLDEMRAELKARK